MNRFLQISGLAFSLCLSSMASAHFVWIAKSGDKVEVRFSESAESSEPELLKNVAAAKVWAQVSGAQGGTSMNEIPMTLTAETLSGDISPEARVLVASHDYGVTKKGGATFLLKYTAKQHLSPLPGQWTAVRDFERIPLEVTPEWSDRDLLLTVTWKGEPQSGLEVKALGCGLDETLTTDAKGVVRCTPAGNGVLSVRAKMVEETSGELNGEKYDSVRTYSTLTLPLTLPTAELLTHALPALPKGITSFGAAIAGDNVYVYGGHFGSAHHYSDAGQSNEFRCVSLKNKDAQWELLPAGPKLTGLALVEYKGKLYRVGGFTAKNSDNEDQNLWSQNSFASFDPSSGQWTDLPALPAGRSSHDAVVMDGKLYVAGGWNMEGPDKTTWHTSALVCDLKQSSLNWTELPAPPFQRRAVSLAASGGRLYVIGGMEESGSTTTKVAIFDPAAQTWSDGPTLLGTGMEGFGTSAFAVGDRLVVTTMSGSVQCLNKEASAWVFAGQTGEPRFFHRQLTTADGRILLVGGASMQTGKTNTVELLQLTAN